MNEQYDFVPDDDNYKEHLILIIDDFHKLPSNAQKKLAHTFSSYQSVILFTDDAFQFDLKRISELSKSLQQYSIKKFSPSLRGELTRKWIKVTHQDLDENQLTHLEDEELALVDKTLGKFHIHGIVPSTPFFILSIISTSSSLDVNRQRNITWQGHCYQALIFFGLRCLGLEASDIDSYINFLTTFAYDLYLNTSTEITEEQMELFIAKYREEYNLPPTNEQLLNNLIKAKLITLSLGKYRFFYPYIFYYFIGKYFSENSKNCMNHISKIVQNLYLEKNYYICIFLIHHSKEDSLLDQIINISDEYFKKYSVATLVNQELMLCGDVIILQ